MNVFKCVPRVTCHDPAAHLSQVLTLRYLCVFNVQ